MPWFRVDDNLAFHPKALDAGNAAMGLWVRAGAWSQQMLTGGFIPDTAIGQLGTKAQAEKLVAARLWDRLPSGYAFHEWEQRQPDAEKVKQTRAAESEAGSLGAHRRWHVGRRITDPDCSYCKAKPKTKEA